MAAKQFFDNLNINEGTLKQIKEVSESIKNNHIENMDMAAKFFDEYFRIRISAIKSFDNYTHIMIESYAKILSQFNNKTK